MKFFSVVSARPELIQAMPVSQALRMRHEEVLVLMGPASDDDLVNNFFTELTPPLPQHTVVIRAVSAAQELAQILTQVEPLLLVEKPDVVIVHGASNTALGTALIASKLQIPLVHIEAGEDTEDMPQASASNRLQIDAISQCHFCSTQKATAQLAREGKANTAYWVGDMLLDALRQVLPMVATRMTRLAQFHVAADAYALVMLQHPINLDNPLRLRQLVQTLNRVQEPILFPMSPRTHQAIAALDLPLAAHIQSIAPLSYLDLILLTANARLVATDSSTLQREAFALLTPCLTLHDVTVWTETVDSGWNYVVGMDPAQILARWQHFPLPPVPDELFGDGTAAQRVVAILETLFGR